MKKILFAVALTIAMPTMAQTMYDGKSCEQWKNEFDIEVTTLKGELKTLQQKAKLDASSVTKADITNKKAELKKAQNNLKVAKQAAAMEKKAETTDQKAHKKSFTLQEKHGKANDKLSKLQTKVTKQENAISKAEQNLQKQNQKLETIKKEIENTERNMQNLMNETVAENRFIHHPFTTPSAPCARGQCRRRR